MSWNIYRSLRSLSFVFLFAVSTAAQVVDFQEPLTQANYATWRDRIMPAKADLAWEQIPWLTTFQSGILQAEQRSLPLMLWTMNGHPLGCT